MFQADSRLQPRNYGEIMTLVPAVGVELERHDDVRSRTEFAHRRVLGHDADHGIRFAVQGNRLSQDARIARESSAAEILAEQRDARAVGRIFFLREPPPLKDRRTHAAKEIRRNLNGTHLLHSVPRTVVRRPVVHRADDPSRHIVEYAGLRAPVGELRGRRRRRVRGLPLRVETGVHQQH